MKKQCAFIFLLVATAINIFSNNDLQETSFFNITNKESQWAFLEKKFITDIVGAKQQWNTFTQKLILKSIIASSFTGSFFINDVINTIKKDTPDNTNESNNDSLVKFISTPKNALMIVGATATFTSLYQVYQEYATSSINHQAVSDFFKNWDTNKFYTPEECMEGFNLIALNIQEYGDDFITDHADAIVGTIQFLVQRHFEKRYEKFLQKEAESCSGEIKNIIDLTKDFNDNFLKFNGSSKK